MNTLQIQLNDRQLSDLITLLDFAGDNLVMDIQANEKNGDDTSELEELQLTIPELDQAIEERRYFWCSSHGDINLEIENKHVEAIARPGDAEQACLVAMEEDGYLRGQLESMDMSKAREYLSDAGIEEAHARTDHDVRLYILWRACGDISEEMNRED